MDIPFNRIDIIRVKLYNFGLKDRSTQSLFLRTLKTRKEFHTE